MDYQTSFKLSPEQERSVQAKIEAGKKEYAHLDGIICEGPDTPEIRALIESFEAEIWEDD